MTEGSAHNASALLRGFRESVALADDVPWAAPFVIDGALGRIVLPAPRDVIDADQVVLFVPEERDDAMQLLVEVKEIEPDAACDRYLAYHGRPRYAHWIVAGIDAVRWADSIIDGAQFDLRNPLHGIEPSLLKQLNADRGSLARLSGHPVSAEPVAIGIDPVGIDIRTRPGLVRVAFDSAIESDDEASELVGRLLGRDQT